MSSHYFSLLILLCSITSCAQFDTGRTFLAEMEDDDSHFFNPSEDFPVVAGDTGTIGNSEKEQLRRTPPSEVDMLAVRTNRVLMQELKDLESSLSEKNLKIYERHRHQLTTISEKIYFLKLPIHDRHEYLMARGFISEPKSKEHSRYLSSRNQGLVPGMSKNAIVASLGKPAKVEVAGNPQNENERWLYRHNGAPKYIYFEAGQVQGWE